MVNRKANRVHVLPRLERSPLTPSPPRREEKQETEFDHQWSGIDQFFLCSGNTIRTLNYGFQGAMRLVNTWRFWGTGWELCTPSHRVLVLCLSSIGQVLSYILFLVVA